MPAACTQRLSDGPGPGDPLRRAPVLRAVSTRWSGSARAVIRAASMTPPGLRWVFDGPHHRGRPTAGQRLPIYLHSLLAALGSSAMSSVNALAVILPRSGFWNSGSLSALLMLFQSGE